MGAYRALGQLACTSIGTLTLVLLTLGGPQKLLSADILADVGILVSDSAHLIVTSHVLLRSTCSWLSGLPVLRIMRSFRRPGGLDDVPASPC